MLLAPMSISLTQILATLPSDISMPNIEMQDFCLGRSRSISDLGLILEKLD